METAPIGKVSKLKSLFLNVTNTVLNYTYHVKTDLQGAVAYSYNFSDNLVEDNSSFEQFLTLNVLPGKVSLETELILNCVSVTSWRPSYLTWGPRATPVTMCVISRTVKVDGSFTTIIKWRSV